MDVIFDRRSIRRFTGEKVPDDLVKRLLQAAMAAPSAGNQQPWEFIVVRDKSTFEKIMQIHPYSSPLKEANVAIVICGDTSRERHPGFWVQDCSAATQNILLEAQYLGLGAVWLGVHPVEERVRGVKNLFKLPQTVIPLAIVAVGYPAEKKGRVDRYDETKVRYEKW
ncbi:MAG TPA: nitroreductase family protein [Clostridia bacterium]|nr:nitroreductase family protein [Clostridia bacterium]